MCVFLINFFHPNEIKLILASGHTHLTRLPWFHIVQCLGRSSGCRPVGCAFGRTWQSYSTGCKCANGVMAGGHFLATVSHATCVLCCFKNAPVHQLRWPWFKCRRWGRFLGSFRLLHWKLVLVVWVNEPKQHMHKNTFWYNTHFSLHVHVHTLWPGQDHIRLCVCEFCHFKTLHQKNDSQTGHSR